MRFATMVTDVGNGAAHGIVGIGCSPGTAPKSQKDWVVIYRPEYLKEKKDLIGTLIVLERTKDMCRKGNRKSCCDVYNGERKHYMWRIVEE